MLSDELRQRLRVGKAGGSVSPVAMLEAAIALGIASAKATGLTNSEWNRTVGKLDRVCPDWRGYAAPVAMRREVAYFTTQDLTKQWGDNWVKKPNQARPPYEADKSRGEDWRIFKCFFDGEFEQAGDWETDWHSVEEINQGVAAWLKPDRFSLTSHNVFIHAGTTLDEFIRLVQSVGGTVYLPVATELER